MASNLGIYASQISGHLTLPSDYESIATVTVGSGGQSSISFSSIPSTYKHLQIRYFSRSDAAGINQLLLQCNGDTSANYSDHALYTNGGGSAAGNYSVSATRMSVGLHAGASTTANVFGVGVVDILDYANTSKYKTARGLTGVDANGSGFIWFASGNWRSTSAITSVSVVPENGSFVENSKWALYGIKG